MIKANELRIGNYILFNPNEKISRICKVVSISSDSITAFDKQLPLAIYKDDSRKGVPITPEILEKAGFVKDENKEHDWINNGYRLRERVGFYSFYRDYEGEDFDYFNDIKHLHQLQNLYFALTGTELEINL